MKKESKQSILGTVSTLRGLFVKWHASSLSKIDEISKLAKQVEEQIVQLDACRQRSDKVVGTPSREGSDVPEGRATRKVAQPGGKEENHTEPDRQDRNGGAPAGGSKLYSEAAGNWNTKHLFQLTVKSIGDTPQGQIAEILKAKINPTEIRVGCNKYKVLNNGNIIIGTSTRQEIETLEKEIATKCEGELEATTHKRRKPKMIIYIIPEGISTVNLEDTLLMQNPDIGLTKGEISAKFEYITKKKNKNVVIEVEARARKMLLQSNIKLGWQIYRTEDYLVAKRCFKC
jgi:hypothetical protein